MILYSAIISLPALLVIAGYYFWTRFVEGPLVPGSISEDPHPEEEAL